MSKKKTQIEDAQEQKNWKENLKQQINDGIDSVSDRMKQSAQEEGETAQGEAVAPAISKDLLQRELALSKADFTHTAMKMTPDLENLLADELKDQKKNTKRSAQMIAVFAKHNFYANGLTPEELRTTLEDLGPTYVKIGQIMSSRTDLLPENFCKELEKLRQNVKALNPQIARAVIEAETGKKIELCHSYPKSKC